ncbi:MAG: hypothetical protein V3R83_09620 [Gammaproteobacteria bacterium]
MTESELRASITPSKDWGKPELPESPDWSSRDRLILREIIRQLVGTDDERWESKKRLKVWLKEIRDSEHDT